MDVEMVCDEMFDGEYVTGNGCHGCSYVLGAAVAFGLMGMAEAIRRVHLGAMEVRVVRVKRGPVTLPPICEVCGYDGDPLVKVHSQLMCENCVWSHERGDFACGCMPADNSRSTTGEGG